MNDLERTFSPCEVAKHFGVKPQRVRTWLRNGTLRGFDVADSLTRPRWRIPASAIAEFEQARQAKPLEPTKPQRRKKPKPTEVIEFF